MAGLRPFLAGIGLVILFGIALFTFMVEFIAVNNPDPIGLVASNPQINATMQSFNARAAELEALGESSKRLLTDAEPSPTYIFLIGLAFFQIPWYTVSFLAGSIGTIGLMMWTMFFGVGSSPFSVGSSPFSVILGVVNGILIIGVVLAIVKAIRTGESER
jgi:hypothetical protein